MILPRNFPKGRTMNTMIFSPLDYYLQEGEQIHAQNTAAYWDLLSKTSNVNTEENATTVAEYNEGVMHAKSIEQQIKKNKNSRGLTIAGVILLWIFCPILFAFSLSLFWKAFLSTTLFLCGLTVLILTCKRINKRLQDLRQQLSQAEAHAEELLQIAYTQTAPLNALFTEYDAYKLANKTFPHLAFDTYFTQERWQQLQSFGFDDESESDETVLDLLSGSFYGYPFLYKRELSYYMGFKKYHGSLTIHWTTEKHTSDGKTETVHHSQTLHATVQKPYPFYYHETLLYYANDEAPDLHFSRCHAHVEDKSDNQIERKIRYGTRKLEKLMAKSAKKDGNFTALNNTEFEVLFNALNRDDEIQFRYLFTPLAQENMLKLLRSNEGFGDDFDFIKDGKINVIRSEHSQFSPLHIPSSTYQSHDVALAEQKFKQTNHSFFKSVFFDFAPLMLIPAYQQPLLACDTFEEGNLTTHSFEAIATRIRQTQPTDADVGVIYKTELAKRENNVYTVNVSAFSFRAEKRVQYVPEYGDDGDIHDVPVEWFEYIPVTKTSAIQIVPEKELQEIPQHAIRYQGFIAFPL